MAAAAKLLFIALHMCSFMFWGIFYFFLSTAAQLTKVSVIMVPYYLTTNNYDNLEPPWASEGCRRLENGKEKKGFPLFPEGLLPAVGCCFICAACLAWPGPQSPLGCLSSGNCRSRRNSGVALTCICLSGIVTVKGVEQIKRHIYLLCLRLTSSQAVHTSAFTELAPSSSGLQLTQRLLI